ncbi:Disease resistance protein [Quillaja saponaria]|uniref:Disease resistance protein n=1 Tax=Quillaja saponaria TaxID=32244 RepID=A0AAD7KQQ4_QUISA|nr:Disease resistance protein [Quillaja saponaria]
MTEIVANLLLDKLNRLLEKGVEQFGGIREEVVYVRGELERIRAFLRVADALEETDVELKVWVKQVRDIAHDTEDVLDQFTLLQAHDHGNGIYGSLYKLSCCIKNTKARLRVASELQGINSRIKNMTAAYKRLQHKVNVAEQGSSSTTVGDMWQNRRGDALLLDKTDLVGIEKPKEKLIGWLFHGSSMREVVSVTGMGGMGKTTLTKQVFDDPVVKKHFKLRVWITVSQSFRIVELLKDMVQQLFKVTRRPVPEGVDSMSNDNLKTAIKELLHKRRYLIVLDDVWHLYEWDAVKYALPNNSCGSRVMLTTRNSEVASTTSIESDGKVYDLKPLPLEISWDLFRGKTFKGNSCPPHLEEICNYIIRKCEGLPLAIVAICGVLATKDKRRIDEWDMIVRSLGAEIEGNDKLQDLKKVLLLSFNDLPYYLKSCFLYLSIFPEDHPIEHMRLIRLWMAEGFIEAKEGKTLEDVAEDYINELLNRSLIQVAETTNDGRVKSFRVHDLLREIIISKSRDQNFAAIAKDQNTFWPDKVRRLAIHNTLQNVPQNRSVSQLRSLFMFGVVEKPSMQSLFPGSIMLLKVLDLRNTGLKRFPVEIVNLYYLKYLSLSNTKVKTIPSFIGKLQNLETLDLKHCCVTDLPDEILKLQQLRHLLVYRYEFVSYSHIKYGFKIKGEIGVLRFLQKLCFVEADQCGGTIISELGKLNQLRRLGILKLRKEDGKALCSSIEKLTNLRALSLTTIEEDEILDLQHLSAPPLLLQRLYLRGVLETLPHWIPSLHSLVKLYLKGSRLKDDPLVFLQSMPNLVHVELCEVFDGDTLCFKAGGFKKLKFLGLDKLDELRCIQVEVGTMPCVENLSIQRCTLLEKVPSGIEYLTNLKVLGFFDMPADLIMTLNPEKEGNDYGKVAHIPEVYSTYWREGGWEVYSLESLNEGENSPCPRDTVIKSHELQTRLK